MLQLEYKVLEKYSDEIDEAENQPDTTYSLKAGNNRDLVRVFQDTRGQKIDQEDDTDLMMTGNINDYAQKLNEIQERYINKLKSEKEHKMELQRKDQARTLDIPMWDCIMPDVGPEGEFKGFKIRPEIAKVMVS